ncbi:MAG: PAS domain-containing protein [Steroidobacteraceae bacterium]
MTSPVTQLRADIDPLASLDPVLLSALAAGAHEMISVLDMDQRILWCGGAVEAISGYSPAERIGKYATDFIHPDDRDYARERTREFITHSSGQVRSETMSVRSLHRDGSLRHVEIAGTRLLRHGAPALLVVHTRDVTQEARALERTARAELRLETALWGADVFVWQLDNTTGELTTLGEAAFEKHGIAACLGSDHVERWLQQVHPDDLGALREAYARQDSGTVARYEIAYRVRTRDGNWSWVLERSRISARNPDATARIICGVCLSIDDTRRLEQDLRAAHERLRLAMGAGGIGAWDWDLDSDSVRFSPEWRDVMGLQASGSPTDWVQRQLSPLDTTHPDDQPEVEASFRDVLAGITRQFSYEVRRQHGSGQWRWMRTTGTVVATHADGRPQRIVGIIQDVHERRSREEALRGDAHLQADVIENVPACIVLIDDSLQVRYATRELLGFEPAAMRGLNVLEFFGPDWQGQIRSGLQRAATEQRNVEIEGVVPASQALAERRYRLHIAPVSGRERDVRWCVVIRDISKALRDETQAFRSIGFDLQRIGHDLRESVGQQLTGTAMLMQSLSADLERTNSAHAGDASRIATLLNHTIDDVRGLSRSLSPVGVAPAGLPAALQGLAEHARAVAVIDARCQIDIAPGRALDAIEADHLFGIAQEAVTNATRHARATQLWIRLAVSERRIELEISDDGAGIDDVSSSVGLTRGLALMTHRARAIGATLSVSRRSPVGTSVRCLRVAT